MPIRTPTLSLNRVCRQSPRVALLALCAGLSTSCSTVDRNYQCSANAGDYSDHDFVMPATSSEITGQIAFKKVYPSSDWHPLARVVLSDSDSDRSTCRCDGIEASWYSSDPDYLSVTLSANGNQVPLGRVPYDKPVTFKFTYKPDGELKLEVGTGVAIGTSSNLKRDRMTMSCSGADIDFNVHRN